MTDFEYNTNNKCKLTSIFDKCNGRYTELGLTMKTGKSTFSSGEFLDTVPYLTERKISYFNNSQKEDNAESRHYLFDTQKPIISVSLGTDYQPDDIVKNNIINNLSNEIYNNSLYLFQNIITKLTYDLSNGDTLTLKNYYNDNITDLKKNIINLNNNKLKQESIYSSKYFDLNKYKTNTNILINSILIVATILVIGILDNNGIISYGFVINGFLLLFLVIYLILSTRISNDRQFSNWDKKYFKNVVEVPYNA
tara:strand:- start:784 stop:1539 length:756 start_codon:yes stop_codon:yes gene_type:complete